MGHNPEGFLIAPPASNSASSLQNDAVSCTSRGAVCGGLVTNTARAFYPRLRTSLRPEPDQMECKPYFLLSNMFTYGGFPIRRWL